MPRSSRVVTSTTRTLLMRQRRLAHQTPHQPVPLRPMKRAEASSPNTAG